MKTFRSSLIAAAAVLSMGLMASTSFAQAEPSNVAPKPQPTNPTPPPVGGAGGYQVKPQSARKGCNSIQQCDKYIAGCIALGPGFDFEPTSVDMLGRPASGYCSRSF